MADIGVVGDDGKVGWVLPTVCWACAFYALAVLAGYSDTAWSIVAIWNRSDTYAHGYLIVPISLWLIWHKRAVLATLSLRPAPLVLALIVPGGLAWLLAHLAGVLVVQQLAMVGIIIVGIWALIGHRAARELAFPLGFLILAVPMGENLVPPMMDLTAASTVWLIQLTGIPVYREGLYFTLPSGNWSVVEACSGVRYLIASFTLGLLYAHLTYRSLGRQLLFVLASIVVPILANTARAYIIVILGHLSDMSIATGVDHLIYGWVFFGLVMLVLFWLGSFWRQDKEDEPGAIVQSGLPSSSNRPGAAGLLPVLFTALVLAGLWPLFALAINRDSTDRPGMSLPAPQPAAGWELAAARAWVWQPLAQGADNEIVQVYQHQGQQVALYLQHYLIQREGAELISGKASQFVDESQSMRITGRGRGSVVLAGHEAEIKRLTLGDGQSSLRLWYWYRIGDRYTVNPYVAKAWEALNAITFSRRDAARIIVATELGAGDNADAMASQLLQQFVSDHLPAIESALDAGLPESAP